MFSGLKPWSVFWPWGNGGTNREDAIDEPAATSSTVSAAGGNRSGGTPSTNEKEAIPMIVAADAAIDQAEDRADGPWPTPLTLTVLDELPHPPTTTELSGGASEKQSTLINGHREGEGDGSATLNTDVEDFTADIAWHVELDYASKEAALSLDSLHRLVEDRRSTAATRSKLREGRKKFNQIADEVRVQNASFLQDVRRLLSQVDGQHLFSRLERLEELHDQLQELGSTYEDTEDQLLRREYGMKQAEDLLYHQLQDAIRHAKAEHAVVPVNIDEDVASTSSGYYLEIQSVRGDTPPPGVPQEIGARSKQRQLTELDEEHEEILREENMRHQVGLVLDEDSQFLLRTYPIIRGHLQQSSLDETGAIADPSAVPEPVTEHFPRHRFTRHDSPILSYIGSLFPRHQFTGHDISLLRSQAAESGTTDACLTFIDEPGMPILDDAAEPPEPFLLSDMDTTVVYSGLPDERHSEIASRTTFINDWMLNKLRTSYLEIQWLKYEIFRRLQTTALNDLWSFVEAQWHSDRGGTDYQQARDAAAKSLDPSMITNSKTFVKSRYPDYRSESRLAVVHHTGLRRPRSKSDRTARVELSMFDAETKISALRPLLV